MYSLSSATSTSRLAARALSTTSRTYATSPWASQQPVKGKRKIVLVGAGFVGKEITTTGRSRISKLILRVSRCIAGSYIAKALVADPRNQVVLASRNPEPRQYLTTRPPHSGPSPRIEPVPSSPYFHLTAHTSEIVYNKLRSLGSSILPPVSLDTTRPETLPAAFEGASAIVSLVGILTGTPEEFKRIQAEGGENVARAAKEAGVKRVVVVSALGIENGGTP